MKIKIHKAEDRGNSDLGWLQSRFSFSFAEYFNPNRMNFGALRVLNDDVIAPGQGFGAHPHKDMEIITIVTEGELAHKDCTGGSGVIRPGEVQVMSAGMGVVHSEYNNSKKLPAKLFQIWIQTKELGIRPRYDQMKFDEIKFKDKFCLVASGDKKMEGLYVHQDGRISLGNFSKGKTGRYSLKKGNGLFFLVISGLIKMGDKTLGVRDAAEISGLEELTFTSLSKSKILAIEVPLHERQ